MNLSANKVDKEEDASRSMKYKPVKTGRMLKATPHYSLEQFKAVLQSMAKDQIAVVLKNDKLLCGLGERL